MEYSEDHIALAAEYALGTLDADERAQVEAMMSVDPDFVAVVRAWEFRLGVLNQMVGSVEPPTDLWERIRTAIGLTGEPQAPLVLPEPPPIAPAFAAIEEAMAATEEVGPPPAHMPPPPPPPVVDETNVVRLDSRARAYRNLAIAMTAIAAALLAIIGVQVASPGLLPGLGVKPGTQVAEVTPTPAPAPAPAPTLEPSAQYVAL